MESDNYDHLYSHVFERQKSEGLIVAIRRSCEAWRTKLDRHLMEGVTEVLRHL